MYNLFIDIFKRKPVDRRSEVQEITRHNSSQSYDKLWSDEKLLQHYLQPARVDGYRFIAGYILNKLCGNRILELGFGSADFLKILIDLGIGRKLDVHGIDYAEAGVKRASKLIPDGTFTHGDIYKLPYADNFFDQVCCLQTMEHLESPKLALCEMDRVCKTDGLILLTVPNGEFDDFEGHVNFWSAGAFKEFLQPRIIIDFMIYNESRSLMALVRPLKS